MQPKFENLRSIARSELLHFNEAQFPPFSRKEIEEWCNGSPSHEALSLLSDFLNPSLNAEDPSKIERLNALAIDTEVSILLAVLDRHFLSQRRPPFDLLALLSGISRDKFLASLVYLLAHSAKLKFPSDSPFQSSLLEESVSYFLIEQFSSSLSRWRQS